MRASLRWLIGISSFCLFFSGLAGLVYEMVWTRYLALFLGHASYAVVAILMAFMGGLALGNYWLGGWADRTHRPLAFYGWVELGIGVYALFFPFYYELTYGLYLDLARSTAASGAGLFALKFGFSLLTVLVPTVLMGGTLPLLLRLLARSVGDIRGRVATLYFVNSLGGVAGIWLADFWWLEAVGLEATMQAAAAMNLLVGLVALLMSGWMREGRAVAPVTAPAPMPGADDATPAPEPTAVSPNAADETERVEPTEQYTVGELRVALVCIGLSGFVAMLYQVAWTRLLALALGSSTHAFSLMLMTFIGGLTLGAWWVGRWKSVRCSLVAFGWIEVALALVVAVSLWFYDLLPYGFARLAEMLARRPEAYGLYQFLQGAVCVVVMLVPTVLQGMTLPLVSRVATQELGRAGRSVGRVFAVNTVGTVLGAGLTGLWMMPALGLARTFVLGVAINVAIALAALWHRGWPGRRRWLVAGGVGLLALVALGSGGLAKTWQGALTMGLWRQGDLAPSGQEFRANARSATLLYHRDGAGSTVSVHTGGGATNSGLFLKVNGKTDASNLGDMSTQMLLGHVPLLLRPSATNVLVVGMGSGVTAGAVASHGSVRSLEVVEIAPEVVEAAGFFAPHNRDVLRDPRLRVVIDDAKSFLLLSDRRYDVIISEPSNPWMAGVAGVFSVEFYQNCARHLTPGGLMVQWVQLYEFSDAGFDMVLATFREVFPYISIWHTDAADVLLVGSVGPPQVSLDAFAARLAEPAVHQDLDRAKLGNLALLLTHEMISFTYGGLIPAPETRIHSDAFPALEYRAQRDFFARRAAERFRLIDENFSRRPETLLGEYVRRARLQRGDFEAFAANYLEDRKPFVDLIAPMLLRWRQEEPAAWEPWEIATRFQFVAPPGELDALRLAPRRDGILERAPSNPTLLRQYGLGLMRTYLEQRSAVYGPPTNELVTVLGKLIEHDGDHQRVYQAYLAELAWDARDDASCLEWGQRALMGDAERGSARFRLDPAVPLRLVARIAEVWRTRGDLAKAAELCAQAVQGGYVTEKSRYHSLLFEVTQRRIERERAAGSGAGASKASSPR